MSTTATSNNFALANPTSNDIRENLGVTPERAAEIIGLISDSYKAHTDEEGQHTQYAMEVIGNLPLESERLFGAWAIGHGLGSAGDNGGFGEEGNPLAALLAEMQKQADNNDGDSIPGTDSEEL